MNVRHKQILLLLVVLMVILPASAQRPRPDREGFVRIFDGKTLTGWKARAEGFWTVKDNAITGQTTKDHPAPVNQFITFDQGTVEDFELKLSFRFTGQPAANGGIQFRSRVREDGHVVGYQADMNKQGQYIGMLYEEGGRGIMAPRGTRVTVNAKGKKTQVPLAHAESLKESNRDNDWNDYHIIARGNKIVLKVNGLVTSELIDNQVSKRKLSGVIAFQLHQGPPMKVQYRNIRVKPLRRDKKSEANDRQAAMQTLKHLALGCIMYAQDHDGMLPTTFAALTPYVSTSFDAEAYELVASGKWSEISQPGSTALIRQKALLADGQQVVAFADGHVEVTSR
ncbi:MAG: DUF1080 domain-containing protein [Planctomycetes bacterium]|nr:DUF1080 domain-containing protein [Planctomycetota bacterium]